MLAPALPTITDLPKPRHEIARAPFVANLFIDRNDAVHTLAQHPAHSHSVFVGIPGNESLSLIAAGQFGNAILFDINENELKAMHNILKIVEECPDSASFIAAIAPKMTHWLTRSPQPHARRVNKTSEIPHYFHVLGVSGFPDNKMEVTNYLKNMAREPDSWLHPKNYGYIRCLQQEARIQTVTMDITDKEAVDALKSQIRNAGYDIGAIYVSTLRHILTPRHTIKRDYFDKELELHKTNDFSRNIETLLHGGRDKWYIESEYLDPVNRSSTGGQYRIVAIPKEQYVDYVQQKEYEESRYAPPLSHEIYQAGAYIMRSGSVSASLPRGHPIFIIDICTEGKISNGVRNHNGLSVRDAGLVKKRLERLLDGLFEGGWQMETRENNNIRIKLDRPQLKPGQYCKPLELEDKIKETIVNVLHAVKEQTI